MIKTNTYTLGCLEVIEVEPNYDDDYPWLTNDFSKNKYASIRML